MTDILTRLAGLMERTEPDPTIGFYKLGCNALGQQYENTGHLLEGESIRLGMPVDRHSARAMAALDLVQATFIALVQESAGEIERLQTALRAVSGRCWPEMDSQRPQPAGGYVIAALTFFASLGLGVWCNSPVGAAWGLKAG